MSWKVYVRFLEYEDDLEIVVKQTNEFDGKSSFVVPPLTMKKYELGTSIKPEDVDIARDTDGRQLLQAFLDAAWDFGLRPRGFEDHTNELSAVRCHLEDMRKLAKVKK